MPTSTMKVKQTDSQSKAMQIFGLESAINARLEPQQPLWPRRDLSPYQIIGIVEDFYCGHLSQPVLPIAFIYGETYLSQIPLQAKITPGHQKMPLPSWKPTTTTMLMEPSIILCKQEVENLYKSDKQITITYSFSPLWPF